MIRHIFRILWRGKKGNLLLIFQLFVSFLAMTLFIAQNVEKISNHFSPVNYNYEDLWGISLTMDGIPKERGAEYLSLIKRRLLALPGTQDISNGSLIPFQSFGDYQKVKINGQKIVVRGFAVDEKYQRTLGLSLVKGRWFNKEDILSNIIPVVITEDLSKEYFGDENPIGKNILIRDGNGKSVKFGDRKARILGVSEEYRDDITTMGAFTGRGCIFQPLPVDTIVGDFLIKSTQIDNFLLMEELIKNELSSIKDEKFIVSTSAPLTTLKKLSNKGNLFKLTIAMLIFTFLAINIFLGISGVFSYSISKRKPEIGLRVATGAGPGNIVKQFLAETILLTSFAIVPGILIALQFFLTGFFRGVTLGQGLMGISISVLFIYLLMIACCLYPSLKISKVQPAEALHEE